MAYNMYSKVPFSPRRRLFYSANKYPPPPAPWSRHSCSIFSSTFSSLSSLLVPFCFFSFREEKTGICRLYSLSRALASPGWRLSRVNCQSQVFPLLRDCLLGKNTFTFTRRGEVLPHCSSSSMRQVYHSRRCCRCIKKWKFKSTAHTIAFLGAILTMHIHCLYNSPSRLILPLLLLYL